MRLFVLYTFFQNEHYLEMKQVVFLYWDWTAYYIILLFPAIKMRPPCQFSILVLNCILQRDMNHVPKEYSVVSKYIFVVHIPYFCTAFPFLNTFLLIFFCSTWQMGIWSTLLCCISCDGQVVAGENCFSQVLMFLSLTELPSNDFFYLNIELYLANSTTHYHLQIQSQSFTIKP
jgi:hypothetical protein